MQLLENFHFYTDCKDAIVESFGDIDIAKTKLGKKYSDIEEHVLEENLSFIKESLGDKILNFFSKSLGGDIKKLDQIISNMKEEEIKFVKDEHEGESKFYKLSSALARLKRDKASSEEQKVLIVKLTQLEKYLRDLIKSHNSIMDDLEKQVDIITKKNNRKADYYNLKRAQDSVETKKMRSDLKNKLVTDIEENEYVNKIQGILGDSRSAQNDLEKAKNQLAGEKQKLGAGDETSKGTKEKIDNVLKTYHDEIVACLHDVKDYSNNSLAKIKRLEKAQKMDEKDYLTLKQNFDKKVERLEGIIQKAISVLSTSKAEENDKVEKKEGALGILVSAKSKVEKLNYFVWPSENLEDQKNKIDKKIDVLIKTAQQAA